MAYLSGDLASLHTFFLRIGVCWAATSVYDYGDSALEGRRRAPWAKLFAPPPFGLYRTFSWYTSRVLSSIPEKYGLEVYGPEEPPPLQGGMSA